MSGKWTPGPWMAGHYSAYDRKGNCVAITHCGNTSRTKENANAHLIAAAPDLYEALHDLLDACKKLGVSGGNIPNAEAALAKARGETQ